METLPAIDKERLLLLSEIVLNFVTKQVFKLAKDIGDLAGHFWMFTSIALDKWDKRVKHQDIKESKATSTQDPLTGAASYSQKGDKHRKKGLV